MADELKPEDDHDAKLETRLKKAFPDLTDKDFAHHATDLYVIARPDIVAWLRKHYRWFSQVKQFTSQAESLWNGAGKQALDIPFAGNWPHEK